MYEESGVGYYPAIPVTELVDLVLHFILYKLEDIVLLFSPIDTVKLGAIWTYFTCRIVGVIEQIAGVIEQIADIIEQIAGVIEEVA